MSEKMGAEAEKRKINPWMFSAFVFAAISAILFIFYLKGGGAMGISLSSEDAGNRAVEFINSNLLQGQGSATLASVKEKSGVYEVNINYKNQAIPAYFTRDGNYFLGTSIISLSEDLNAKMYKDENSRENSAAKEAPKTDKPIVEAFIFSYCPYGLQFEKALFPVYDLLKNKADFRIVAIGAMHGEYEKTESLRQISIEKIYGTGKLFAYLKEFNMNAGIGNCRGEDSCLEKYLPGIYQKLGIEKSQVESYMNGEAIKIYDEQNARASSLGVSGSPTFVINNAEIQVSRTAEAIKKAVCSAFSNLPEECSETLSTNPVNPGFG